LTSTATAQRADQPAAAEEPSGGLEEITVTARKREENLQVTPISITAFSAKGLEERSITRLDEIANVTPNLVIKSSVATDGNSASAAFFIRGIGQSDFLLNVDPGVGVYVDGVYVPRSIGGLLDLLDPERIEVLRGPQGTLFGRNTIGGAVSITSQSPSSTWGGYGQMTVGSYNRVDVVGRVSGPVTDDLRVSLSGEKLGQDPYVTNVLPGGPGEGNVNSWTLHGQAQYTPTDRLTIDFSSDITQKRELPAPDVLIAINPNAAFVAFYNGVVAGGNCTSAAATSNPKCFTSAYIAGPFKTYGTYLSTNPVSNAYAETYLGGPFAPKSDTNVFGTSAAINYNFDLFNVKFISAYRSVNAFYPRDTDHSPLQVEQVLNTFFDQEITNEIQVGGTAFDQKLKWIVGAFYDNETGQHRDFLDVDLFVGVSGGIVDNDSLAFYTQETYDVTDKLSVTGGERWTHDIKRFTPVGNVIVEDLGLGLPVGTPFLPNKQFEAGFTEPTPYANISYKWTPDFMTYVSYSKGYKSGGFTQRVFPPLPAPPSFEPEIAKVWEVGAKWSMLDQKLRINGAAFHTSYDDLQINVLAGISPITQNAAAATIEGFELETEATPIAGLLFQVSTGYLNTRYDRLDASALAGGLTLGDKLVNAPRWTISASGSYDIATTWGTITPRIDWSYRTTVENDALNHVELQQEGYGLLNASLSYRDPAGLWTVTAGGQNVLNRIYIESGFWDLPVTGIAEAAYGKPAEWFLKVKRKF
jgi:iron complex outermembrane receptor protein